jgi:hypothetical protein
MIHQITDRKLQEDAPDNNARGISSTARTGGQEDGQGRAAATTVNSVEANQAAVGLTRDDIVEIVETVCRRMNGSNKTLTARKRRCRRQEEIFIETPEERLAQLVSNRHSDNPNQMRSHTLRLLSASCSRMYSNFHRMMTSSSSMGQAQKKSMHLLLAVGLAQIQTTCVLISSGVIVMHGTRPRFLSWQRSLREDGC